jgi:hypothetical protein
MRCRLYFLLCLSLVSFPAMAEMPAEHLPFGPGSAPVPREGLRPDSILTWGDGEFESGLSWGWEGVQVPYYGAFAECFSGDWLVVGAVLDFTTNGPQGDQTYDIYIWDHDGGIPGSVLNYASGFEPGPIAAWPEYTRCFADFPEPFPVEGDWFIGWWPDWPGEMPGWYLACDHNGPIQGCLMTNIAPGIGYPSGWQDMQIVWGPHTSVGVSALVRPPDPVPVERTGWGSIKALFR